MTELEPEVVAYIEGLRHARQEPPTLTGQDERDPASLPFWATDPEARREYVATLDAWRQDEVRRRSDGGA